MTDYNKLVRDKIPQIISTNGQTPLTRTLDDAEYLKELIKKAVEEAGELLGATSIEEQREELADLEKVVESLKGQLGTEEVDEIGRIKDLQRGGFENRIFLERTE